MTQSLAHVTFPKQVDPITRSPLRKSLPSTVSTSTKMREAIQSTWKFIEAWGEYRPIAIAGRVVAGVLIIPSIALAVVGLIPLAVDYTLNKDNYHSGFTHKSELFHNMTLAFFLPLAWLVCRACNDQSIFTDSI